MGGAHCETVYINENITFKLEVIVAAFVLQC